MCGAVAWFNPIIIGKTVCNCTKPEEKNQKEEREEERGKKEGDQHKRKMVIITHISVSRKQWSQTRKEPKR